MSSFDEGAYKEEVDDVDYEVEEEDGLVEEVDDADLEEMEEEMEADDEDEQQAAAGGGDAGGGGQPMLYIPGLGSIPLSSLGNIPGLSLGGAGGARGGPGAGALPEGEQEWKGLKDFPNITQESIADLFGSLREDGAGESGKDELTVLMLGKGGVGKSSTVNSLLNEKAANVASFQQDNAKPVVFSRRTDDGFLLTVIDTPSILDQDAVSEMRLESIVRVIKDREIDAVLYMDRLDCYAVDSTDKAVISGITRMLGPRIWANTIVCFSRASESSTPPGMDFYDHLEKRESQLKQTISRIAGSEYSSELSVALVENSSRCPLNSDGEKVVPGDTPWLVELFEKIVDTALNVSPYEYVASEVTKASDPNRRRKWLIPLFLALQIGAKFLLDRVMEDDDCKGDEKGPFDAKTVQERRDDLRKERERSKKKRTADKAKAAVVSVTTGEDESIDSTAEGNLFEEGDVEEDLEDDDWE